MEAMSQQMEEKKEENYGHGENPPYLCIRKSEEMLTKAPLQSQETSVEWQEWINNINTI